MLFLPSLHFPCFHNNQSPPPRNTSLQKNFRGLLKKPLAALPLLLLLASCGGGSGGSGGPVSGGSGGSDPLPPSGPAPARVSKIKPRPGSVTQSSNLTDIISIVPIQEIEEYTVEVTIDSPSGNTCISYPCDTNESELENNQRPKTKTETKHRWVGFHIKNGDKWIIKNLGSLKTEPYTEYNYDRDHRGRDGYKFIHKEYASKFDRGIVYNVRNLDFAIHYGSNNNYNWDRDQKTYRT